MPEKQLRRYVLGSPAPDFRPSALAQLSGYTRSRAYNRQLLDDLASTETTTWQPDALIDADPKLVETIGRAYDGAVARSARIEAKAVGLLQVIAIGYATLALTLSDARTVVRILGVVGLLYLTLATVGAVHLLRPRPHSQVTTADASQPDGGLAETAKAAKSLESGSPWMTNVLDGVVRDLVVGGTAVLLALSVLIITGPAGTESTAPLSTAPSPPSSHGAHQRDANEPQDSAPPPTTEGAASFGAEVIPSGQGAPTNLADTP